ncbi:MAG: SDR family NAD(P)-dependent oxidoreductase [Archangium sp.]
MKTVVIYGAGAIGRAAAHAFRESGANVFLTSRRAAQGVEVVDALDEVAIDMHLKTVVERTGGVDVSFNAIGVPNAKILGAALSALSLDDFTSPLLAYVRSYFLTSRLAARHMVAKKSGVIMTVTALHSRVGLPLVGGYGVAMAAKEALTRQLSAELAPHGVRVVGLRPQAMPETPTIRDAFEPRAEASGLTWEQWQTALASRTHPRRLMALKELTDAALFAASDAARGFTGTTMNLTLGSVDD